MTYGGLIFISFIASLFTTILSAKIILGVLSLLSLIAYIAHENGWLDK